MKILDTIFKKPIGIIASFYLVVFLSVVGLGLFYISNNNALIQNSLPPKLADTLGFVAELDVLDPRISSAVDITKINNPDQAMLDMGKKTFTTVCASCHGNEGKGDGAAGVALNPKPRNFHDETGWKNGRKFFEVYGTLQVGILASGMPAYDYMPAEERVAVINYIRTFMTNAPIDSPEEIAALDAKYGLSAGTKQPGQVPITSAMKLVVDGKAGSASKIDAALSKLSGVDMIGYEQFTGIADNYRKALTTVLNSGSALNDVSGLKSTLLLNAGSNGFSAKVYSLSETEFQALFQILKTLLA